MTSDQIISAMKRKGYIVKEDDSKPFNLNIVGIRSSTQIPNSFDDQMNVFWKFNGNWNTRIFPCTTDPGTHWLRNPSSSLGTGILKEGQWIDAYQIALHQGKYKALCQRKPVTLIRDFDLDNQLDFYAPDLQNAIHKQINNPGEVIKEWYDMAGKLLWREATGLYGANIHRANENGQSILVDKWSAACQVLQNRYIFNPDNNAVRVYEFDYFMYLMDKAAAIHGNKFSYTLLNQKDFVSPFNTAL